ncbi:hypothetical protein PCCS19_17860 [Paenibacillus sp. CCS19]|uniref:DUF6886 family protein n=1 Tax=Paenibacillus sp. CCS19 TaxID=3158387 RepID=UPI00256DEC43|nr:DUF6886 family protein [Paenibacillus cellulosilyticus]GMK38732.1 hypothetical protein PCCS19_17860 [Paenibacillus cellulosilyticus]
MRLFHFSGESDIEVFYPRVKATRQDMPPVVWAIDEEHQFTFYVPRDCPRIICTRSGDMSEEDIVRFFGTTASDIVMTVETGWYERIKNAALFRYELPSATFRLFDESAGYYISEEVVTPVGMDVITNPLDMLIQLNIDIRFTPNLHPLRNAILGSTLTDFGIHRFGNAAPMAASHEAP